MTQIFVTNATPVEYVARLDVRKVAAARIDDLRHPPSGSQSPTGTVSNLETSGQSRPITAIDLKRMAGSIAAGYGDKGAVVITCGPDGFRIGVSGLTHRELQDALCVANHYNFCHMEEASAS